MGKEDINMKGLKSIEFVYFLLRFISFLFFNKMFLFKEKWEIDF